MLYAYKGEEKNKQIICDTIADLIDIPSEIITLMPPPLFQVQYNVIRSSKNLNSYGANIH